MYKRINDIKTGSTNWVPVLLMIISLVAISFVIGCKSIVIGTILASIPVVILSLILILKFPYWGFVFLFIVNYFIIAGIRYWDIEGLSVVTDVLMVIIFIAVALNYVFSTTKTEGAKVGNGLIMVSLTWFLYCALELLNPTSMTSAWFLSRSTSIYLFMIPLLTILVVKNYRDIKFLIVLLSVLTILGIIKALMQKFIGFDAMERAFLDSGAYRTHILTTGTRYFSFYPSAGIFGAVMGHAFVVFSIVAIYANKVNLRIYFGIVALASLYGLLISGTRGALAVPVAGFALFLILSKQIKIMIPTFAIMIIGYVFLAMTTIGQSNALIRRMRTVLDPNEPSLMVRKENQKLFAEYLTDKPFGEGLGLSGVDAQSLSERYTTSIATDSWFVKIWVETGVVGLCLHLAIWAYLMIHGSYIIFFKIKDRQLRGILAALLCGVFGILVSSYSNQVLGQYPVALIVYISIALVFMGTHFDKQIEQRIEH